MSMRDVMLAAIVVAVVVVGVVVVGVAVRAIAMRAFERRVEGRLPVGRDGVIPGAEPIELRSAVPGAPAALLLHGFGDTPQTLRYLAASLHTQGWSVRVPLLPGHGRTIAVWAKTTADNWLACAREELEAIRRTSDTVAVVGLSMGAALATVVTVEAQPGRSVTAVIGREGDAPAAAGTVRSLVLLAPYFVLPGWIRWAAAAHRIVSAFVPYFNAQGDVSILDPTERLRSLAYGATTPRLVHELGTLGRRAWGVLPDVAVPTLIVQSHADNRTAPQVAEGALARITAPEKQLVWIDDGGHVITVDRGHEAVEASVAEWLDAHAPSRARARKARPA